ncbi:hypothetical protein DPMN_125209 [Dreissena polymorpha]|uniref:Uncharacterized protein n=1 Tax=Dreissena polymorpha TaxID=45954 RepID=A0A9D4GXE0_DREPO|nr:hypothetical protein DPMN_125209 [Dreissena polymorpha]
MFSKDKIEVEAVMGAAVNPTFLKYHWTVSEYRSLNSTLNTWDILPQSPSSTTG